MGSSSKKKKDKQKDFKRPKLKVGKEKPKASNFTDTSFKSKSITLNQQSLSVSAPAASTQFAHNIALLTSRSDSQRRDSLGYLTTSIANHSRKTPLPQPVNVIMPRLFPLFLDGSNSVRGQLVRLLQALPPDDIEEHVEHMLLYIRAGMTHLSAEIRGSSMDILRWVLGSCGQSLVSCAGGWVKTLNSFLAMLGWPNELTVASWSSTKGSMGKSGEGKAFVKALNVLTLLLQAGLTEGGGKGEVSEPKINSFPLVDLSQHMLPTRSNCYAYLNLFGSPSSEENRVYEDLDDRRQVFRACFQEAAKKGLLAAKQEGGEVGRAASAVQKVMMAGMVYQD